MVFLTNSNMELRLEHYLWGTTPGFGSMWSQDELPLTPWYETLQIRTSKRVCAVLLRPLEGDVVVDDGAWPDGQPLGRLEVELDEREPVSPGLSQQLLDELDGQ